MRERGAPMGGAVQLAGVAKRYGGVVAVAGVDLDVAAGEFLTLLGPSGSGKTTLLLVIAGFVQPDEGEVGIDGQSVVDRPPYKRDIGVVFQSYALFPHMTVAQNVAFPLEMRRVPHGQIRQRVAEALGLVQLRGYEHRLPRELSGGQQQRVALARAMVFRPPLLLMDEPLGALDRKLRQQMQLEIKHLQRSLGLTVIYVTHDQEEALTMSNRIAVVHGGRVEQIGSPRELYDEPASRFVANFIGESNLFECTLRAPANGVLRGETRGGHVFVAHVPPALAALAGARDQLAVCVRPERVRFLSEGEHAENALAVRVEEVIFQGDSTRYQLVSERGERLVLRTLARTQEPRVEPGAHVCVGWDAADCVVVE